MIGELSGNSEGIEWTISAHNDQPKILIAHDTGVDISEGELREMLFELLKWKGLYGDSPEH